MALTPLDKYPTTNNPNVFLDPHINGGDNRRMFVQVVHEIRNGAKVKRLGFIFLGYNSRKWTATIYGENETKNKVRTGMAKKTDAVAIFEKLVK